MTSQSNARSREVRTCSVEKDQRGYGLTVHGTRPVIVQSVRAEGAAWKAGIRERDEILEVNGVSVEGKSHSEVVKLIKEKASVEFKVTAGSGRRANGSSRSRTTISTKTTVTQVGERRSDDPEHFREISAISPEAAKHLRSSEKQPENDVASRTEGKSGLRASVTSPRPWVSALHQSSSPTPVLEEPADEIPEFPLTHSKSCSMPEQAASAAKPSRSKSDAHNKRRPVSMDVTGLEATAAASGSPTPSPANSNSNLSAKQHSKSFLNVGFLQKWVSNPRVDDPEENSPAVMHTSATLPPPAGAAMGEEEEEASGHRRTQSLDFHENKYGSVQSMTQEQAFEPQPIIIDDDEEMGTEEEHAQVRKQIELFADLAKVFDRCDLTATLVHYGHEKANTEEGLTDFHRLLFLLVMLEYRRCSNQKDFNKDHKRLAYEIYSSFLAYDSPLSVQLSDPLAGEVAEPFKREDEETTSAAMRSLLIKAQEEAALSLKLLDNFRNEMERGLDTVYTEGYNFCVGSRERRVAYFDRKVLGVNSVALKLEESPRRSAILSALASASRYFQTTDDKKPYRSTENLALTTVTPFNTTLSKSKSTIFNRQKKSTHNMHSLSPKNVESFQSCDFCTKIISGTAPQADACHHCTAMIHRECRQLWARPCDRDRSKRTSMTFDLKTLIKSQPKRDSGPTSYEARRRPPALREGSEPPPATSPNAETRNVEAIVSKFNESSTGVDDDRSVAASLPEERLSRSESLKLPPSRHNAAPWSHRSFMDSRGSFDSSLHSDAIVEADSLSLPSLSSSSDPPDRSPSMSMPLDFDSPEVAESDVKRRLEKEPFLERLPADVQDYFQLFEFREYYERLGREGSRKGKSYLKDYQSACCEIYFQELSHLRNLKVMQFMFVEPWPPGAEDLRQMMGLDKIRDLIELRTSLLQELTSTRKEEGGKKFVNMGQGYLNWLTDATMVQLKCLLGSIRYKGENHFDKLLADRQKRLNPLLERTFNKLNLFDMMISVNQHACRPSLLMAPVKKALGKLVKSDESQYQKELETWKLAETKLTQIAKYLDQLKRRVVDIIPKIDATKLRELPEIDEENVPEFKDVPRSLISFLFLRDADCQVKKEREGKVRDTRLLQFADFLVLLYQESKDGSDRYVMRPWEYIMPILPHSRILHVIHDLTSTGHTLLLAIEVDAGRGNTRKDSFLYMTFKNQSDMECFKQKLSSPARQRPKLVSSRGAGLGSSASMSETTRPSRLQRSGSNRSTQSMMPSIGQASCDGSPPLGGDKDGSPELQRQDSGDNKTLRAGSSGSTQSLDKVAAPRDSGLPLALRETRQAVMERKQMSEAQFKEVADLLATEGAKDANELEVVLVAHLGALVEQLSRLSSAGDAQEAMERLLTANQNFQACLEKSVHNVDPMRHSVFEDTMTESQASTSLSAPRSPSDDDAESEGVAKTPEADSEEETEEEEEEEEKAEADGGEEEGTPVALSDNEDQVSSQLRAVASDFVQRVMAQAVERYRVEQQRCGAPED